MKKRLTAKEHLQGVGMLLHLFTWMIGAPILALYGNLMVRQGEQTTLGWIFSIAGVAYVVVALYIKAVRLE